MVVQQWSDDILLVDLAGEPQFSDDLAALNARLDKRPARVVLNLRHVTLVNSSNLTQMLRLRKRLTEAGLALCLTGVPNGVWSVMLTTGLDKIFTFAEDVPSALASLQLDER